ncbi:MAG: precorrin-2 C(20)-methyltransferase [Alphaproteobacteria bacterium GM7ARS4]|nr:precorrin-2 C(20)-methyltransferase [Alphaproteobacteria bacterium GM7ARS4]
MTHKATHTTTGTLYGVGVGPGDPSLLTLKAVSCIERAHVLAWIESPQHTRSFDVVKHLRQQHHMTYGTPIDMGNTEQQRVRHYDHLASRLKRHLCQGHDVAYLTLGDPLLYGSFTYLMERLRHTCAIDIIPGIPSFCAVTAHLQQCLAQKQETLTILTAQQALTRLAHPLNSHEAIVILKGGKHIQTLRRMLEQHGDKTIERAFYAEHVGTPQQTSMPLCAYDKPSAPYFSLIVITPHRSA